MKVMSEVAIEVTTKIATDLSDCIEDCKRGRLSNELRGFVIRTILKIMDEWNPRLNYRTRCEVLDWVEHEFGICM